MTKKTLVISAVVQAAVLVTGAAIYNRMQTRKYQDAKMSVSTAKTPAVEVPPVSAPPAGPEVPISAAPAKRTDVPPALAAQASPARAEEEASDRTFELAALPAGPRRKSRRTDMASSEFYVRKFLADPRYDCVVGGDSRVMMGVSPGEMSNTFRKSRIYNFAFSGNTWTKEYIDALESTLDPSSKNKRLVLGISPVGLTFNVSKFSKFAELRRMSPVRLARAMTVDSNLTAFDPMVDGHEMTADLVYHDDGWAANLRPFNFKGDAQFRSRYSGNVVATDAVNYLMGKVREWTSQGIKVYGFRTPVSPETWKFETKSSRFNEEAFVRRFNAEGGRWIEVSLDGLGWNDGHHLIVRSALVYSDRLAKAMSKADATDETATNPAGE